MAERIAHAAITSTPERILRAHHDLGARRSSAVDCRIDISDRLKSVLDANMRLDWRGVGSERPCRAPLQIPHHPRRPFQAFLDAHQERPPLLAPDATRSASQR